MQALEYNKLSSTQRKKVPINFFYIRQASKNKKLHKASFFYVKDYKDPQCLMRKVANGFININLPKDITKRF